MVTSITVEYAHSLALLEGDDFQLEVSARLQSVILGFQVVPARPQGDAGLDGFSHNGERAYCCYGPERDAFKHPKSRAAAVVTKFTSDLRRLFELDVQKKGLVQKEKP